MLQLKLGDVDVTLVKKKIKNIYLRVEPHNGQIKVSAPLRMPVEKIQTFVLSKIDWITQQQEKAQIRQQETPQYYIDDETIYFNGQSYILRIVEYAHKPKVNLEAPHIVLHVRPNTPSVMKSKILETWYQAQLTEKVTVLIADWQAKMGIFVKQFKIRKMKTRWGSCSPHSKSIRINLELAKKPPECLEYIVVHELAHLLEPSHNKRFVALMTLFLPQWRVYRKLLNQFTLTPLIE